jgi:hypothetical protein
MITGAINNIMNEAVKGVIEKLQKQLMIKRSGMSPMNTTGTLKESIKAVVEPGFLSEVEITSEDYGLYLNKGIPNVPYTRGSGGGHSQYILGLKKWCMIKFGLSSKKALQMAFAVANTQKKSLGGNASFTQAPANPGWVDDIKNELDREAGNSIHNTLFAAIQLDVYTTLNITI